MKVAADRVDRRRSEVVGGTRRVAATPLRTVSNPGLAAIRKDYTDFVNPNFCHPWGFAFELPGGMDNQAAVTYLAQRMPMDGGMEWLDYTKLASVRLDVTDKNPAEVMRALGSLASGQSTSVDWIAKRVVPFLTKEPDSQFFAGTITAIEKRKTTSGPWDGEFVAVLSEKTREVVFLLTGNLFPGVYDENEGR